MSEALLAAAHHGLAFAAAALIAIEFSVLSAPLDRAAIRRLCRIDLAWGLCALGLLAAGLGWIEVGAHSWSEIFDNPLWLIKLAAFLMMGLLSIRPSVTYLRWRRRGADSVANAERLVLRPWLAAQFLMLAIILSCAALIGRGYGQGGDG